MITRRTCWPLALTALLAVLALAGCSSTSQPDAGHRATAAASPPVASSTIKSQPAGCGQVLVVVGTVRGELENAPDDATLNRAYRQLAALGKSVPLGTLRLDVDRANFDMTQYWERESSGEPATKWAAATAADLQRLDRECG